MNNNSINIQRLVAIGGKEQYSEENILENVECYIEQMDPKVAVIFGDKNAFNSYKAFVEGLDAEAVKIGDKVTDVQGNEYVVSGVTDYANNDDVENSIEIIMVKKYVQN